MNLSNRYENILDSNVPQIQAKTIEGILYFTIDRGFDDKQFWKTDGTAEGTVFVSKKNK